MGTCISKCNPNKTSKKIHKKNNLQNNQEECKCTKIDQINPNVVQDKLVISQIPNSSIKSPVSPTKSSSSCTNSNYPTTSSSSSSGSLLSSASSLASSNSSSSIVSSKLDQSFSNDYLGSCPKEKQLFIRPNYYPSIKEINPKRSSLPTKCQISGNKLNGPKKPPSPQKLVRPLAQKRPRCNSPSNLTRQKSFRLESESETEPNRPVSISGRYSRPVSPSPSRRFTREISTSQGRNFTNSMRRDNSCVKPPSPRRTIGNSRRYNRPNTNLLLKNDDGIKGVSSKIQELALGGLSTQDIDMMPIEDAENPHITLDCFIFL
ncbi:uncharacterized protein LOC141596351 [Silene latifolia]|uniref:uncharacterized protein LOC141596351 n=1 Tax=Silene latifolia TaxID=37657 RepID=UPI003D77CE1C